MKIARVMAVCLAVPAASMAVPAASIAVAEELKLPPEVTPELRAACEGDVRRIGCLGPSPTYAKVKSCVISKYTQLGIKCKTQLALAGYSGPSNVPKSAKATTVTEGSANAPKSAKGGLFDGMFKEASAK